MTQRATSFRDPAGTTCLFDQRVLRLLTAEGTAAVEAFLETSTARDFCARNNLVRTRRLEPDEITALSLTADWEKHLHSKPGAAVFEHERIPFANYPYEWPAEMLWEAGQLTLELAATSLEEGYGLKDATPFNVLFRGAEPVFVDLASFERRRAGDPVWNPYGQFVRTFLLPLLAYERWGVDLAQVFLVHRDGLEPEHVYSFCGPLERFRPQILGLVTMPTWLGGKGKAEAERLYQKRTLADPEKANFILASVIERLRKSLAALKPKPKRNSTWSNYMSAHTYSESAFGVKQKFVGELFEQFKPERVLDVGSNTGHFSVLAAQAGAEVVAIDADPACVGQTWRRAREQHLAILPLVMDLSRPSPGVGWRNRECSAFLDRTKGFFDGVFMLAVVHHLLVTERIPLEEIIHLAAELTTSLLIIEFIAPQDEMFRQLTRGRDHLHADLDEAAFERVCAAYFEMVRSQTLPGTQRRLYGFKRKEGAA